MCKGLTVSGIPQVSRERDPHNQGLFPLKGASSHPTEEQALRNKRREEFCPRSQLRTESIGHVKSGASSVNISPKVGGFCCGNNYLELEETAASGEI